MRTKNELKNECLLYKDTIQRQTNYTIEWEYIPKVGYHLLLNSKGVEHYNLTELTGALRLMFNTIYELPTNFLK